MAAVNNCNFIGNIGKDPELRYTATGQAVCDWSLAVTKRRNGADGQRQEETLWVTCTAWGKLAETANQYVRKGGQLYVNGEVSINAYADKSGNPRAELKLKVDDYQLLGSRGEQSSGSYGSYGGGNEDEVPF